MTETTFPPEVGQPLKGDGRVFGSPEADVPYWVDPICTEMIWSGWMADGNFMIGIEKGDGEKIAFSLGDAQAERFFKDAIRILEDRDRHVATSAALLEQAMAERGAP